jgi:hypothetical protein
VKIDEGSLQSFKASAEKFRVELEEAIIDMYAHLHLFQQITTTIIEQHSQVQAKNTQFNTIREGIVILTDGSQRILDAPVELPHPSSIDRKG